MNKRKGTTIQIVYVGMFAALLSILSQLAIPMPSGLPITLQTFAIAFTGVVLNWKLALSSTTVYILMGAVGVPVFANFTGGIQILFHYSGGFIWGFLFLTSFCGIAASMKNKIAANMLAMLGLLICHILGILQFGFVMNMGFIESAVIASLPYLVKDIISVILAYFIGQQVRKRLITAALL